LINPILINPTVIDPIRFSLVADPSGSY